MPTPQRLLRPVAGSAVIWWALLGSAAASPAASCPPLPTCLTASPTPSPTPSPPPRPSPTRARTASPRPSPTHTATAPPTLAVQPTSPAGGGPSAVVATFDVGAVASGPASRTPSPGPAGKDGSHGGGLSLAALVELVLGGAVLLGIAGGVGLYLTRHPAEHRNPFERGTHER